MLGRHAWSVLLLVLVGASTSPVQALPPGPRVHVVQPGETLRKIADRYRVPLEALYRVNGLDERSTIHPDQRLLVPSPKTPRRRAVEKREEAPGRSSQAADWRRYLAQPASPGLVTLVGRGRTWRGRVEHTAGELPAPVRAGFRRVLFSHRTGAEEEISTRLIRLLVQVSDAFGGRPLHVVSGYRETSEAEKSRHKTGRACDFYVAGVPNEALVAYLHTLQHVGVGFYPNSTFVHLDVRAETAWWTDVSGPGERPRYVSGR